MAGYIRQDTSNNIANGNVIDAEDLNKEFNAVEDAFNTATGHAHSGAAGDGGPITVTGPAQEYISSSTSLSPKAGSTYDLGGAAQQWNNLYVAGTADLAVVDIEGGNIDGTVIGAATPAAGNFTTVLTTGNLTVGGTITVDDINLVTASVDSATITSADINGGTIDATVIGGTTPAAGTFTTATATGLTVNGNITVTGTVDGVDVALLKSDFDTLEASVEANQDAFSSISVGEPGGDVTLAADAPQDVLSIDAGTGITLSANPTTDTLTITNSAPDQTVSFTNGLGIAVTGTYPDFTVTNSAPDQTVTLTQGTGITIGGSYPNFTVTNSAPDQTVTLTQGTGITIGGTYPNFSIASSISEGAFYYADGTSIELDGATNTFSHADTSPAGPQTVAVNTSNNEIITGILIDDYGHITSISTGTLGSIDALDTRVSSLEGSQTPAANNASITISGTNGITGGGTFTTDQSFNETITLDGSGLQNNIGVDQDYVLLKDLNTGLADRVPGTVYQNTTGKPILVVSGQAFDYTIAEVGDSPSTLVEIGVNSNNNTYITTTFIVPAGYYYVMGPGSGGTPQPSSQHWSWTELR